MMLRSLLAAALLAVAGVHANKADGNPPTLYDYDYNGATTYCYWLRQGLTVDRNDYTYVYEEGVRDDCPLEITLTQTTTTAVKAGGDVEFQMAAVLNFDKNVFQMDGLQSLVLDPNNGRPVQIAHANVHACFRSTVCDIFRDGSNRRVSGQETSNFTYGIRATFNQKINFNRAGEYNVFAHIILPAKNPENETYHFLAFTTTTIDAIETVAKDAPGMAMGTIIAIIVGGVALVVAVVVGVIFYRRRPAPMTPGHEHFRNSGFHTTHTSKYKQSKLDWNGDPDFQFGHDNYQHSMASEFKQPPGLDASALMFKDRSSRMTKQKTVSSSGSTHRLSSAGYSDNYYGNGARSSAYPQDIPAVQLPTQHGIDTYDTYYNNGGYTNELQSFTTEGSVGTGRGHGYAGNPRGTYTDGGYDNRTQPGYGQSYTQPDSAMDDYTYDERDRADTGDTLRPVSEVSRGSEASSMGTVEFDLPPLPKSSYHPGLRPTGDSFQAENVPNLADTQLTFNDAEVSKQTIEYIDSLRSQQYRPSDQASDYVSDFGSTSRTFDYRDSSQSDSDYTHSYRSTDHQFTDTKYRKNRAPSADSESYEF